MVQIYKVMRRPRIQYFWGEAEEVRARACVRRACVRACKYVYVRMLLAIVV